jgi:hypothetical protein
MFLFMGAGKSLPLPNLSPSFINKRRDRTPPVGYKVSSLLFDPASGSPVAASNSLTAATDIFSNANLSNCPDACFRPVGLALDSKGRIFVSSDTTGEIYVLVKTSESPTASGTSTGASPTATKKSAGSKVRGGGGGLLIIALVAFVMW